MKRKFIAFSIDVIAIFSLLLGSMAKNNNQIIKKYCVEDKPYEKKSYFNCISCYIDIFKYTLGVFTF